MRSFVFGILIITIGTVAAGSPTKAAETECSPRILDVSPDEAFVGGNVLITGECLSPPGDGDVKPSVWIGRDELQVISSTNEEVLFHIQTALPNKLAELRLGDASAAVPLTVKNWIEPDASQIIPGTLHVKVESGVEIAAIARRVGAGSFQRMFEEWSVEAPELQAWWSVSISGDPISETRIWAQEEGGQWVQPSFDSMGTGADIPNDPCYDRPTLPGCAVEQFMDSGYQYGQEGQWGYHQIQAPSARDIETGSPQVIVGVFDSGVAAHADLVPPVIERDYTGSGPSGHRARLHRIWER